MTSIKERAAVRLLDALYDADLPYAQYVCGGKSKLLRYKDANGNSLLHYMAYSNMIDQIELLVKLGVDTSSKNKNGETALHWAAKLNSIESAAFLIRRNPGLVNEADGTKCVPLHYAAENAHPAMVSLLLKNGADIWARDYDKYTAYDIACEGFSSAHVSVAVMLQKLHAVRPEPTAASGAPGTSSSGWVGEPAPLKVHPLLRVVEKGTVPQFAMTAGTGGATDGSRKKPSAKEVALLRSASSPAPFVVSLYTPSPGKVSALNHSSSSNSLAKTRLRLPSADTNGDDEPFVLTPPDVEVPFLPLNHNVNEPPVPGRPAGMGFVVIISVEQCHDCGKHEWSLWHDEDKYTDAAEGALLACVCSILSTPQIPVKLVAMRTKAPKTRLGAMEVVVSALVTDIMGPGRFLKAYTAKPKPVDADAASTDGAAGIAAAPKPTLRGDGSLGYRADPRNGGIWIHHQLHSKLKTKTWPHLETIQAKLQHFLTTLKNHSYAGKLARSEARETIFKPPASALGSKEGPLSGRRSGRGITPRTTPRLTTKLLKSSAASFWESGLVSRADADYDASEQYASWWRRMEGKETVLQGEQERARKKREEEEAKKLAEEALQQGESQADNFNVNHEPLTGSTKNMGRFRSAPQLQRSLTVSSSTSWARDPASSPAWGKSPATFDGAREQAKSSPMSPSARSLSESNLKTAQLDTSTIALSGSRSPFTLSGTVTPTGREDVTPPPQSSASATLKALRIAADADVVAREREEKAARDALALPCYLQHFEKPTGRSGDKGSKRGFRAASQPTSPGDKGGALAEYEKSVLAHFLAFDNSRPPESEDDR